MIFEKIYNFHFAAWIARIGSSIPIVIVAVVLSGCSQTTPAPPTSARRPLDERKFEMDRQREIFLTHDASTPALMSISDKTRRPLVCEIDLPILHIATGGQEIADEPKVPATLKFLQPGIAPERFPIAIEWRGRTSQTYPKKSFGFELRDRDDFQKPVKESLLGMRQDDDWILDALWNEPVSVRDFTAHQIWRQMAADHQNRGDYDLPQQKYCELFLDGEYCGIYYLGERVDPKMLKVKNKDGQSHGLQFKAVSWADGSSFKSSPPVEETSDQWSGFEKVYPKLSGKADFGPLQELVALVTDSDSNEFNQTIQNAVQIDNAVDYFIFINLLAAMDNRGKNYYLVRQHESSKWFFVPWDLDLTAGICFPTERKDVMELRMYNGLFRRLMQQPEFVQAVTDRWNHLRSGLFEKDNLKSLYRQNYQRLAGNGIYDRQQRFPELRGEFESPSSEIDFLEQWLDARVDFLDGWLGNTARLVRRLQRKQNPPIAPAVR